MTGATIGPGGAGRMSPASSPGVHVGPPVVIGLSGPIGCGKSSVGRILGALGGTIIDADALARQVTSPGQPALAAIRARFGEGVSQASGALDRAALAALVFDDPDALRDLEAIVHPYVRVLVEAALERAAAEGVPFVAIEAIKLVEGGLVERCQEVWLIDCRPTEQRERLRGRGLADADIERRLAAQGDDLTGRLAASLAGVSFRIISSSGSLEMLRERVEDALAEALAPLFPGLPVGRVERSSGSR